MGWLFLAPALFGIWRYRYFAYWRYVAYVGLTLWLTAFLFSAGGTLSDPTGDGVITGAVRTATDDGPEVLLCLLGFLPAIALCFFFLSKLHKTTLPPFPGRTAAKRADTLRKAGESVALVGGIWVLNVVMAALIALFQVTASPSAAGPVPGLASPLAAQVSAAARSINAGTPKQIDELTMLDSVTSDGTSLVYNYTLTTNLSGAEIEERMSPIVHRGACVDPDMRATMREGASFRYSYTGTGGGMADIDVTDDSCAALRL